VSQPGVGFDHDTNAVVILDDAGSSFDIPLTTKSAVADAVFDRVSARLSAHERKTPQP
jgi:phosphopantothenoylcysteine synthetase/decarboxylase